MKVKGIIGLRATLRVAALLPLLTACGASRQSAAIGGEADAPPGPRRIADVPFFEDGTNQCGPSTLASVLTFAGRATSPDELKPEIYSDKTRGTLPMDLLPAVEDRGLSGRVFNGTLEELKAEIRDGRPVLAYLNLGVSFYPQGHFVVVTGYDDDKKGVYAHDAKVADKFIPYRRFMKGWNKTDRWALTVIPRQEWVPASPS